MTKLEIALQLIKIAIMIMGLAFFMAYVLYLI